MGYHPLGNRDRQAVERMPHSGTDTFHAVERTDGGQHMARVGSLTTTGTEQPVFTEFGQKRLEQEVFSLALEQPGAKLAHTEASKPASSSGSARRYFQSMRDRTASAACSSPRRSANW